MVGFKHKKKGDLLDGSGPQSDDIPLTPRAKAEAGLNEAKKQALEAEQKALEITNAANEKLAEMQAKFGKSKIQLFMLFLALYFLGSGMVLFVSTNLYLLLPGFWWLRDEGVTGQNLSPVSFWLCTLHVTLAFSLWVMSKSDETSVLFCHLAPVGIFFIVFYCALENCYLDVLVWGILFLCTMYFGYLEGELQTPKFQDNDTTNHQPRMTVKMGPDTVKKPEAGREADIPTTSSLVLVASWLLSFLLMFMLPNLRWLGDECDFYASMVLFATACVILYTVVVRVEQEYSKVNAGIMYTSCGGVATGGPLAYTRNPIFLSMMVIAIPGVAAVFNSVWFLLVPWVFFGGVLVKVIIPAEEKFMLANYPAEWTEYCNTTPQFFKLPGFLAKFVEKQNAGGGSMLPTISDIEQGSESAGKKEAEKETEIAQ